MLSALDIVLISLGGCAIVIYTTLKIIQVVKFKRLVKLGIEHNMTEAQARENAYRVVYNKRKYKNADIEDVNEEDNIYED